MATGPTSSKTKHTTYDELDVATQDLIKKAVEARTKSYSPYSNFKVGCAVQCDDGTVFTGCNVENVSFGLSVCAERTAIVKAVSEGRRKFTTLAVIGDLKHAITTPCGMCREFMAEFGLDIDVYMTRSTLGEVFQSTSGELIPYKFRLDESRAFE